METAKKHLAQAMRKVREKYKKAGKKMRWMANIEVGTKGAWHVHIVINRIADADIIIKDAWEHGAVTFKHLYEAEISEIWPDTSRKHQKHANAMEST